MIKKRKWLSWAVVISGIVVILLLVIALYSEPIVRWLPRTAQEGESLPSPADRENRSDILGAGLITILVILIVTIHLGLLLALATPLNKPKIVITTRAVCPQCNYAIHRNWRLCPNCGYPLDKSTPAVTNMKG